jgi:hypothetical protein
MPPKAEKSGKIEERSKWLTDTDHVRVAWALVLVRGQSGLMEGLQLGPIMSPRRFEYKVLQVGRLA